MGIRRNDIKHAQRGNSGFTMMELVVVIVIMGIVGALAFAGFAQYQKSVYQREIDETAKEIYMAAQNHATIAESTGMLKGKANGTTYTEGSGDDAKTYYYFVVGDGNGAETIDGNKGSILYSMLPYGSIDETVRDGGSYVIRYQTDNGAITITDVFYSKPKGGAFGVDGYTFTSGADCTATGLFGGNPPYAGDDSGSEEARTDYKGHIIGWYGGEANENNRVKLSAPKIVVHNGDRLEVDISKATYDPVDEIVELYVTGLTSGKTAVCKVPLEMVIRAEGRAATDGKSYVGNVVLDDIASTDKHFAQQFSAFIPGENIEIFAVSMSKAQRSNLPKSSRVKTNSLFSAVVDGSGSAPKTVNVASIRHLENLANEVSGFVPNNAQLALGKDADGRIHVAQTQDMSWTSFVNNITSTSEGGGSLSITGSAGAALTTGSFYPVHISNIEASSAKTNCAFEYNGQGMRIADVVVSTTGDNVAAGLFDVAQNSFVKDLELNDFSVTSAAGNAGALVGTADTTTFYNVLVRDISGAGTGVTGGGNAGGLAGDMTGGAVNTCAASIYVSSSGNAGGLVGNASGAAITASYSGAHTTARAYSSATSGAAHINVQATGNAGGLVGNATSTTIAASYSTASTSAPTAGGLVGTIASGAISRSYAVGTLFGEGTQGALIGSMGSAVTLGSSTNTNRYNELNNVRSYDRDGKIEVVVLPAIGSVGGSAEGTSNGVADVSSSLVTYRSFVNGTGTAAAYDSALTATYPMPTVATLSEATVTGDSPALMSTHFGDWALAETEVVNK